MNSTTRREALILIAAAPRSAPRAAASTRRRTAAPGSRRTPAPDIDARSEMKFVAKLTDLVIPRTDTPGASDAGVPEFIDRRLTASPDLAAAFRRGLSLLDSGFIQLPTERQIAILTELSNAATNAPDTDLADASSAC